MGKPRPKNFSVDRDKRASTLPGRYQDPQKSLSGAAETRNGRLVAPGQRTRGQAVFIEITIHRIGRVEGDEKTPRG